MKLKGLKELSRSLDMLAREELAHTKDQVVEIGGKVLDRGKDLAPRDTGALANSGRLLKVRLSAAKFAAIIRFGSRAVDYALYVHWDPSVVHPQGEWRYLSKAMSERGDIGEVRFRSRFIR
jgi:hypothetical protein